MNMSDIILATSRDEFDTFLSTVHGYTGKPVKSTDEQWQQVRDLIHDHNVWLDVDMAIQKAFFTVSSQQHN